jgi:hypothetical protein
MRRQFLSDVLAIESEAAQTERQRVVQEIRERLPDALRDAEDDGWFGVNYNPFDAAEAIMDRLLAAIAAEQPEGGSRDYGATGTATLREVQPDAWGTEE